MLWLGGLRTIGSDQQVILHSCGPFHSGLPALTGLLI